MSWAKLSIAEQENTEGEKDQRSVKFDWIQSRKTRKPFKIRLRRMFQNPIKDTIIHHPRRFGKRRQGASIIETIYAIPVNCDYWHGCENTGTLKNQLQYQ